jgi:cyclic pyranopterin phosphate synthase
MYCNPKTSGRQISNNILTNREIIKLVKIFVTELGFSKIRLTGGEPFSRKNIIELFEELSILKSKFPFEFAVTTNGTLLNGNLMKLKNLGLDRFNFSFDSLKPFRYKQITGRDKLNDVLGTIDEAEKVGFQNIKINTVIIRNVNDDEIPDFIEYSIITGRNVRFIEYMPFSNNGYDKNGFLSSQELLNTISKSFEIIPDKIQKSIVAKNYLIPNTKAKIGFISPISEHFCGLCNRLRVSSEGKLKLCLFSRNENDINLLYLIRNGFSDEEIALSIRNELLKKEYAHPEIEELIKLKNNNIISLGG